jgi:hypothetical protein
MKNFSYRFLESLQLDRVIIYGRVSFNKAKGSIAGPFFSEHITSELVTAFFFWHISFVRSQY